MIEVYYYYSEEVDRILKRLKDKKLDRDLYELLYHTPIIAYHASLIGLVGFKAKLDDRFDNAFYKKCEYGL